MSALNHRLKCSVFGCRVQSDDPLTRSPSLPLCLLDSRWLCAPHSPSVLAPPLSVPPFLRKGRPAYALAFFGRVSHDSPWQLKRQPLDTGKNLWSIAGCAEVLVRGDTWVGGGVGWGVHHCDRTPLNHHSPTLPSRECLNFNTHVQWSKPIRLINI